MRGDRVKSGVCKQGRSTTSSVSQYALQDGPGTAVLTVGMYKTDGKGAPSNKQPLTSLTLSCRSFENIFNSKGWASHSRPSAFLFAGGIDLWARHLHPGGARPSSVGGTHRVGTQTASPSQVLIPNLPPSSAVGGFQDSHMMSPESDQSVLRHTAHACTVSKEGAPPSETFPVVCIPTYLPISRTNTSQFPPGAPDLDQPVRA